MALLLRREGRDRTALPRHLPLSFLQWMLTLGLYNIGNYEIVPPLPTTGIKGGEVLPATCKGQLSLTGGWPNGAVLRPDLEQDPTFPGSLAKARCSRQRESQGRPEVVNLVGLRPRQAAGFTHVPRPFSPGPLGRAPIRNTDQACRREYQRRLQGNGFQVAPFGDEEVVVSPRAASIPTAYSREQTAGSTARIDATYLAT